MVIVPHCVNLLHTWNAKGQSSKACFRFSVVMLHNLRIGLLGQPFFCKLSLIIFLQNSVNVYLCAEDFHKLDKVGALLSTCVVFSVHCPYVHFAPHRNQTLLPPLWYWSELERCGWSIYCILLLLKFLYFFYSMLSSFWGVFFNFHFPGHMCAYHACIDEDRKVW